MAGRRRSAAVAIAIAVVATLAASCSNDPDTPPAPPSPFFTTGPTGTSSSTGATGFPSGPSASAPVPPPGPSGSTGSLPTSSPGGGTGNLDRGTLQIRTSGDIRTSDALRQMVSTVYAAPPGGMALVWTAGGVDPTTVGFGGLSFTGTERTSNTLIMTLTIATHDGGFESFTSQNGECTVSISTATANALRGSFRCGGLTTSTGPTIGAVGTFQASG